MQKCVFGLCAARLRLRGGLRERRCSPFFLLRPSCSGRGVPAAFSAPDLRGFSSRSVTGRRGRGAWACGGEGRRCRFCQSRALLPGRRTEESGRGGESAGPSGTSFRVQTELQHAAAQGVAVDAEHLGGAALSHELAAGLSQGMEYAGLFHVPERHDGPIVVGKGGLASAESFAAEARRPSG